MGHFPSQTATIVVTMVNISLTQDSKLSQMSKSVFIEKSDSSFQISVNAVTSTLALVELYSAPLGRYKSEVRDSYKIES